MVNQKFICDIDRWDYLSLEIKEDALFAVISGGGAFSYISIKSQAKIQELIDCLETAKKELSP